MKKTLFIAQLRATAKTLEPLTKSGEVGSLSWNGNEYVRIGEPMSPDPYALSWHAMLTTIADLLERQESPISASQQEYLKRLLFGAMGSLNDLSFDSDRGIAFRSVNSRLTAQRENLYESFIAE